MYGEKQHTYSNYVEENLVRYGRVIICSQMATLPVCDMSCDTETGLPW